MYILRIALAAGIVFTVLLMIREMVSWRTGRSVISARQKVIRLCSGIGVILLLTLILTDSIVGVLFTPGMRGIARNPHLAFAYFSAYMGIACLLIVLALLDAKEALRAAREDRLRIRNNLFGGDGGEQ